MSRQIKSEACNTAVRCNRASKLLKLIRLNYRHSVYKILMLQYSLDLFHQQAYHHSPERGIRRKRIKIGILVVYEKGTKRVKSGGTGEPPYFTAASLYLPVDRLI